MRNLAASFLIIFFGFCSLSSACEEHRKPDHHLAFQKGIHAHISWEAGPQPNKESILKVVFKTAADHKETTILATPELSLWMPSMGHGSSPTSMEKIVDEQGNGKHSYYLFKKIYFIMNGDWDVRLTLKNIDGTEETQSFSLRIKDDSSGKPHH